jgi:hypothetical protein
MSARGDFKKFVRQIERAGGIVEPGRGGHVLVYVDGVHVTTLSNQGGSKGYSKAEEASRRTLRRAGLKL